MPIHARRTGWVYAAVLSWRLVLLRVSFLFFLALSLSIYVWGHANQSVSEKIRVYFIDVTAPVLDILSRPIEALDRLSIRVQSYRALLQENEKLRSEIEKLMRWQNTALALNVENKELKALLNFKAEPRSSYISARSIADAGGAFVRSLVVTAGSKDGAKMGMAAVTGDGLVGRIVEVGERTSRILLLTDTNSRIPVYLASNGEQAVLAGDNDLNPRLLYLTQDSEVREGERVMTSGHGGIFPPNLPVGVVTKTSDGGVEVLPLAILGRISHVTLVDYQLPQTGAGINPVPSDNKHD